MIATPQADVQPGVSQGIFCPWLDNLRGPDGANHLKCRLTAHIFGPGSLHDAVCLRLCAYPKQHERGRCQHMDITNVLMTEGDPPLPRIRCKAHRNYDAPGFCYSCKDYLAPPPPPEPAPAVDPA